MISVQDVSFFFLSYPVSSPSLPALICKNPLKNQKNIWSFAVTDVYYKITRSFIGYENLVCLYRKYMPQCDV